MKKRKQILYITSSIFFALILFVYATANSLQNGNRLRQVTSETYTNTVANVPVDIQYDSNKYFISGFASEVSVVLTGANRVTLASEMQESTRKFKVVADLTNAKMGTVEVPLSIKNLTSGITATVNPAKMTIKIGKKASKSVLVKPSISKDQLADGVTVESVSLGDNKVTVTSDRETLKQIDHIKAVLPSSDVVSGNYSGTASLQAVDKNGSVLPSVVTPYETSIKIMVKTTSSSNSTSSSNN
ncbi:CdaR family protein [Streptococcus oricebi]|uniref:YbbR-like protein n=1 Tax=Streptococcus oricebi TaxID=1547447 RepID=A0ABS5B1Z3_9STRE|nr:CdaR family protein [Streptococcus oricebi]MBP2622526.1 hypothetical protein [Streptococcus oricebi]